MNLERSTRAQRTWWRLTLVAALCLGGAAQAQTQTPKQYDFAYTVGHEQIQVFDDGFVTRMQLPEGVLVPTVIAVQPEGEVLLTPRREPPYLVFEGLYSRLALRWSGKPDVKVVYSGNTAARLPRAAAFGSVVPQSSFGAIGAPVNALAGSKPIANASAGAMPGIPAYLEAPPAGFDLQTRDATISGSLRRWASATQYQLVWDVPPALDAPVTADVAIGAANMRDALERVLAALQRKGYDLQATVYSNRVIRFSSSGSAM